MSFLPQLGSLLLFPDFVRRWQSGEVNVPITLEIHPTERCNHRCPACQAKYAMPLTTARSRARYGSDLDLSLMQSIWEDPPQGVIISGNTGDPLLHAQLPDLLNALYQRHLPTVLVTNGEAMTPELATLVVRTCRGIRVSLNASDAQGFLRTHGRTNEGWLAVLASIRYLVIARRQLALSPEDCFIGVGYLTDAVTKGGMKRAACLARDLGVDYIQFRPFHYRAGDIEAELAASRDLETKEFHVLASSQKYERMGDPKRSYSICHGSHFFTVVDARGDLYICCHQIGNPSARFGSLVHNTWSDIIRSVGRRTAIADFHVAGCPPLCRLHAHNEALEGNRSGIVIPELMGDPFLLFHAPFL